MMPFQIWTNIFIQVWNMIISNWLLSVPIVSCVVLILIDLIHKIKALIK